MTGGVGFAGQGRDSYRQNRQLMNQRASMKDNPYSSVNNAERIEVSNYDELITWKRRKLRRDRKRAVIIVVTLVSAVLLAAFLLYSLI